MPRQLPQSTTTFPVGAWYVIAASTGVGRQPLAVRALGKRIVAYRDSRGAAVVLEDRCAHSSYPLSLGTVEGDDIRCGYSGFKYGPDGAVNDVPSQEHLPTGIGVAAYPTREQDGLVWVWMGAPGRAGLRPVGDLRWLHEDGWSTFGDDWVVAAGAGLLQDNFADITHIAHLDPQSAPPALHDVPPPITVTVSEMSVSFERDFPPAPVQPWMAEVMEIDPASKHAQREVGRFVSPGLWVDRWDVDVAGQGERDGCKTVYFTHAITPIDERTTHHLWRVSRNFSDSPAATGTFEPIMRDYYAKVRTALETIQQVIDQDGPRRPVTVRSDAAKVAVRKIMRRLNEEDGLR